MVRRLHIFFKNTDFEPILAQKGPYYPEFAWELFFGERWMYKDSKNYRF